MSYDLTPTERLLGIIDSSIEDDDLYNTEIVSVERIASLGKPAVTSLYAESFLAIDSLPKKNRLLNINTLTMLKDEARGFQTLVDQAIELNPLYKQERYAEGKELFDWSIAVGPRFLDQFRAKESPKSALTDRNDQEIFPELGLAALYRGVLFGFSLHGRLVEQKWQWMIPSRVMKTMEMNGSLDARVSEAVKSARQNGTFSDSEFVEGLLSIANKAGQQIVREKSKITNDESTKTVENLPVPLSMKALIGSAYLLCGSAAGELIHFGLRPDAITLDWKSAVVGAIVGGIGILGLEDALCTLEHDEE